MRTTFIAIAAALLCLLLPWSVTANDIVQWQGFIAPEARLQFNGKQTHWQDSALPDLGTSLLIYPVDFIDAKASLELDLKYASVAKPTFDLDLQELWVRAAYKSLTFSVGKQFFRWGTIGEFGVADVLNPQELPDTTQLWSERKLSLWAGQFNWQHDAFVLEVIAIPVFVAAEHMRTSPFLRRQLADINTDTVIRQTLPTRSIRSGQAAARLYFPSTVGDFAISGSYLFNQYGTLETRTAFVADRVHPRVGTFGVEASIPIWQGISLNLESLLIFGPDWSGTDPLVRNLTLQTAAALKTFLGPNADASIGIADEQVFQAHSRQEKYTERQLITPVGSPYLILDPHLLHFNIRYRFGDALHQVSFTYLLAYESDGHAFQPELTLRIASGTRLHIGGQYFAGPRQKSLGSLKDQSNIYTSLRVDF